MKYLDFRSDTLTMPGDRMRARMAEAPVGDDYYHEDPTIRALEDHAAELMGKEAALFVLSGTMGNLVSIRAQVPPGSAAIVSASSHLYLNETGHMASICGLTSHPMATPDGRFDLDALEAQVPKPDPRPSVLNPRPRLVCVENTHNGEGGRVLPVEYLTSLRSLADARQMVLHMDGARVFNAAVALGCPPAAVAAPVHSVSFCLSKGLGAPGGAIVAAARDIVDEARHWRQMVGGGMRQAGILAAAGLIALQENIADLGRDHDNARRLASGLIEAGLEVDLAKVETNIVMAYVPEAFGAPADFHARMKAAGIATLPPKGNRLRFVTHRDLSAPDIDLAVERMLQMTKSCKRAEHV